MAKINKEKEPEDNELDSTPADKGASAEIPANQVTATMELEAEGWRDNTSTEVFFRPSIIAGICEACGPSKYVGGNVGFDTIDGKRFPRLENGHWEECNATTCPHYGKESPFRKRWEQGESPIQCAYCGERLTGAKSKLGKLSELLATRCLFVVSLKKDPKKVIMYCDQSACKDKHLARLRQLIS
jgi:hypothetical protein